MAYISLKISDESTKVALEILALEWWCVVVSVSIIFISHQPHTLALSKIFSLIRIKFDLDVIQINSQTCSRSFCLQGPQNHSILSCDRNITYLWTKSKFGCGWEMDIILTSTQAFRLWKNVSSLEKLQKDSGGETFPSAPLPGAVTSHTLSPSVIWKTAFNVKSRFVTWRYCPEKVRFFMSLDIRCSIKLKLNGMYEDEEDVVPYYF